MPKSDGNSYVASNRSTTRWRLFLTAKSQPRMCRTAARRKEDRHAQVDGFTEPTVSSAVSLRITLPSRRKHHPCPSSTGWYGSPHTTCWRIRHEHSHCRHRFGSSVARSRPYRPSPAFHCARRAVHHRAFGPSRLQRRRAASGGRTRCPVGGTKLRRTRTRLGLTVNTFVGHFSMSFVIATVVLVVTLLAAAVIAPRPFHALSFRFDPCALEPREWGVIDPGCADMHLGQPSWTHSNATRRGEQIGSWTDRPVI